MRCSYAAHHHGLMSNVAGWLVAVHCRYNRDTVDEGLASGTGVGEDGVDDAFDLQVGRGRGTWEGGCCFGRLTWW